MQEQTEKRGPGRPRKKETRQPIAITLAKAILEYMDSQTPNRSQFIEQCITEHQEREGK